MKESDIHALNESYKLFIDRLRARWLRDNNHRPKAWVLYETDEQERARVEGVIRAWERYVTPIAERWWQKRGFGIIWPEESSDRCQIYKLETLAA